MRVLLVEDNRLIAQGIVTGLRANGCIVDAVGSAAQADLALATLNVDVMILNLGLPDENGMSLLRRLRTRGVRVPILVLTARDSVEDRVAALRAGADDYLLKPFDLDELVARLHALTRRMAGRSVDVIEDGRLRLDPARGEVWLDESPVALTRREMALLMALLRADGRILSPDQLKDRLYDYSEEIESNALNVHICHLRRKLGPNVVKTVRGLGYRYGGVGK
ncbi:response regulator [Chromobacterium violaceum]|uniref:DNA-binding response regulator n=2 Tax=Chromobacterium violaceum TaxID=536 RepID=A0A1R0MSB1_CHRVL|nr:response regulator [Chromobacterium violaceum]AAQ60305.1 probable two-component response regulator [Chromobacterium violaceum ATCC 12472]KMN49377.1 transcriptional regulator [Chromobacterium violaceum]KMN88126.1 transcriptional regulator [Chromobacterium violaceum]KMN91222.1 transcriptional regulator [Chromobacterium violaceum]KMO04471.1 transcriptional regulator [Chromobacterium violaceum]